MIKTMLLAAIITTSLQSFSQAGGWRISINNRQVVHTDKEDEKENVKTISLREWKKAGYLVIRFQESEPKTWKRSFLFFDENDNQVYSKAAEPGSANPVVSVGLSSLRRMFKGKKEIRIYTTIAPIDPNVAVRVRRVHLCTLRLP